MGSKDDLAVLVGNGLSIAFNSDLQLQSITEEVVRRIEDADGGDVVAAMKELAARALPDGVVNDEDFETLVGAFGAESRTLETLRVLADLKMPDDDQLSDAIARVARFVADVRDNGISHVLEVIAERSRASTDRAGNLNALLRAIVDAFPERIVFGNLNYDALLLAGLLTACQSELADMADGRESVQVTVNNNEKIEVPRLRTEADFPPRCRVRLLHLHGSLTYWADLEKQAYAKLRTSLLDHDQWQAVRKRTTSVRPVVVLANRRDKTEHVCEYPFKLAYEAFSDSLAGAEKWLIVGYSFRDDPVNAILREKFMKRDPKPRVLLVTYGDCPDRASVEMVFGWGVEDGPSDDWLTIDRDGADGIECRDGWKQFALAKPVADL